eukprot:Hpha_TRINITY_DN11750_c1_g1::TRINITY_DN11750_c1_g1_i1::g.31943::m.31943
MSTAAPMKPPSLLEHPRPNSPLAVSSLGGNSPLMAVSLGGGGGVEHQDLNTAVRSLTKRFGYDRVCAALGQHEGAAPSEDKAGSRFTDGGGAETEEEPPRFYDPSSVLAVRAQDLPRQVAHWEEYRGALWSEVERSDLMGTVGAVVRRSRGLATGAEAVAIYTVCALQSVVWAVRRVGGSNK